MAAAERPSDQPSPSRADPPPDPMSDDRATVVITGASAGVGRAAARAFARRGARVALLARGEAGLAGAKADVEALGGEAIALRTDVADAAEVEAAAAIVEEHFGPIDVWVNNAMTSVFAPLHEIAPEEFQRVTEVTYLGTVYGTMAALKRMRPRDRGTIVQVGSALAFRSIPLQSAYCGAKAGVVGFTDSLRSELIHERSNVHLTAVHLPALNTPQFGWVESRLPLEAQPVPPIFQPEVAADAIVWAADPDHRRREWFVGGVTNVIVWGHKFFPAFGDWYLGQTGYGDQQTEHPRDPERPSNLWQPVDQEIDHGAHGSFDRVSRRRSRGWAGAKRGGWALLLGGLGLLAAGALAGSLRSAAEEAREGARSDPTRGGRGDWWGDRWGDRQGGGLTPLDPQQPRAHWPQPAPPATPGPGEPSE